MAEEIKEVVEETKKKNTKKSDKPKLIYPAKPTSKLDFTFNYISAHAKDNKEVADWLKEYYSTHEGDDLKLPQLRSKYAKKFWEDKLPNKNTAKVVSEREKFWNEINNM